MATICRDLTAKETVEEVKKNPIEFKYYLGENKCEQASSPNRWAYIDKLLEIDYGRCLMAAYDSEGCSNDCKAFYIGYWNDGVAE